MDRELTLTGWKGATFGLRVDAESKCRVFFPLKNQLRRVRLVLHGHEARPCCSQTPTFWTTCPEFRSVEIGRWMDTRGDKPWPHGRPPKYRAELVAIDGDTAEVHIF